MENSTLVQSNEITIREIIETLFRGKIIIAIITILAIILSGIISFFVLPEIYESRVVVMANPVDLDKVTTDANSNKLIDYLTSLPSMTLQTYMEQVLTVEVLNNTITELDLRDNNGKYIHAASLRSMLGVKNIGGTNLIEITVSHSDPVMASRIANTLADQFILYVSANTRALGQRAVDLISEQLINEEENLNIKSMAIAEYLKNNMSIDVLIGEVSNIQDKIIDGKSSLIDLDRTIQANQASLSTLQAKIKTMPDIDPDSFSFIFELGDPMNDQQLNIDLGNDNLSVALLMIEISRLQTNLINDVSDQVITEKQVIEMENQLVDMQIELTESEYKYNALVRDMNLAQQSYDAYQQKFKEATLTVASDIGKTSVIITSAGSIPVSPVKPNKMLNIAIAAVLGIILGVFAVMFRDYWQKSKPVSSDKVG